MAAVSGATVTITFDVHPDSEAPGVGEYLRTRAGRWYRVIGARPVRSKYPRRWKLLLCVLGEQIPADDPSVMVHDLVFYPRRKR